MSSPTPTFSHRSCYVNFAEHLQNAWNPNMFFPGAPNIWTHEEWGRFLTYIKACGFSCFEYWVPPTLFDRPALDGDGIYANFADTLRMITEEAHARGVQTKYIAAVNTIGPEWYFACPNATADKALILNLWRHWARELKGTDIVGIFPGDPGGCNRNGCTHETFVELALELTEVILQENPGARIELGTWGTPFSGWGSDLWTMDGWDGSWKSIFETGHATPEEPMHIWNGRPERAARAMEYLISRLPAFPEDMLVAINLGFDPDATATMGGDARPWARKVAKLRAITSWDYSVAEGELITYPHWRLPRMADRRREERSAAPYAGGMSYTMSPKLNLHTLYAAGQLFLDPDADPDHLSREFCTQVFGEEHAVLGELFEAFEVVNGWGSYPRRKWSRGVLRDKYREIIERLEAADVSKCTLPLFPDPETYRQDILWFARQFHAMAGPDADRTAIRQAFWQKSLAIYDHIPMSADARADAAADGFASILAEDSGWVAPW
ncbi:MAG: hypothetical protein ACYDBB_16355 [Armatimonadota bacterium]